MISIPDAFIVVDSSELWVNNAAWSLVAMEWLTGCWHVPVGFAHCAVIQHITCRMRTICLQSESSPAGTISRGSVLLLVIGDVVFVMETYFAGVQQIDVRKGSSDKGEGWDPDRRGGMTG